MKQRSNIFQHLSRRGFLNIMAVAGAAGALWHFGFKQQRFFAHTVRQSRVMMGTQINLTVHGPDPDSCTDAVESTFSRMEELVGKLSRHNPQSELSLLNDKGFLAKPGNDIKQVLLQANQISRITDGAFDVTILPLLNLYNQAKEVNALPPTKLVKNTLHLVDYTKIRINDSSISLAEKAMGISLDGIGKGYIVDQGTEVLQSKGYHNVYVEAGGDLMVTGPKSNKKPWRIGIQNPRPDVPSSLLTVEISNKAVATSGDYMQPYSSDLKHHHILDPRTGFSPPELASATVMAPNVALADSLATAAMVMGPERSVAVIESMQDCEGIFIDKQLKQYQTAGFHV